MKRGRLEPLISRTGLIKLLEDGINKGHWTLQHLDNPPPSWHLVDNKKPWRNPLRDAGWTDEQLTDDF